MSGVAPLPDRLERERRALTEVRRLLALEGLGAARVATGGHRHEILAVAASLTSAERLRALAPRLKALGFRYITLELDPETGDSGRP